MATSSPEIPRRPRCGALASATGTDALEDPRRTFGSGKGILDNSNYNGRNVTFGVNASFGGER